MGNDLRLEKAPVPAVDALAAQALELAEPHPRRALALADAVDRWPVPGEVSLLTRGLAAWAAGRASRHLGRHRSATVALESAVQLLGASGDRVAAARASVSLSTERIDAGRFDDAIALLDTAAKDLSGGDAARAAAQRALVLQRSGRVIDTVEDWDRAVTAFEAAGMPVQAAMARQNRGLVQAYRGELAAAEEDLVAAAAAFSLHGEDIRGAEVLHDRGFVAARRGDLPGALALFDRAQSRSAELGALRPEMLVDRVEVCLRAGLSAEGRALAEAAVRALEEAGFAPDVPEACLLAARACEQDGDPAASAEWARRAVALFRAQRRPRWQLLARYAVVRAEAAARRPGVGIARRLLAVAGALRRAGWAAEAEEAEVRAAEVLIGAGRLEGAGEVLAGLAPGVARMLPLSRLQFRLCQSRLRWAEGDARGAEQALLAGLRALSAYLATLGSIELRAAGGGKAGEIMSLGVTMASARGRPARALWWMETVHGAQQAEPDDQAEGPELAAALASLRDVMALLAREPAHPRETTALRQRQAVLEEVVRRCSRHAAGTRVPERHAAGAAAVSEALGQRLLVEYAPVGRHLVAVVLDGGRCRLVELAPLAEVREAVAGLRLALRTALDADPPAEDQSALREAGADVQRLVLGPLGLPPGREVVIVPDGPVLATPWALLPDLATATAVVAASAQSLWRPPSPSVPNAPGAAAPRTRAQGARAPRARVVALAGPDLRHAEEETEAVAELWGGAAEVLVGREASVAAAKSAMSRADIVHIAAHSAFRGDNPLLSAVRLDDGPITGHELARATRNAKLVVLSCCDSGMADASGIGLSRLLTGASATAVVASVSPVPDFGAVGLMRRFHGELVGGATPAVALAGARRALGGPYVAASSAGFVCFGNGFARLPARA
jgi:tetratricopeptide (TPR) repeat protein